MKKAGKPPERIKEQQEPYIDRYERYEIIDGIRYDMLPSPALVHQLILGRLYIGMHSTCHSKGTIVISPMDVTLDEENTVQPDLIFIAHENTRVKLHPRIEGAPDLLVEILSKSNALHDKRRKKALYERFQVWEYWIVDPEHLMIEQLVLDEGAMQYRLHAMYGLGDLLTSERFPCAAIDLNVVFEGMEQED